MTNMILKSKSLPMYLREEEMPTLEIARFTSCVPFLSAETRPMVGSHIFVVDLDGRDGRY